MQYHDKEIYIMPYSISQNAAREKWHAAVAVVYYEDPEILLEEHFQLLKNSPHIHKYKYKESMDSYI